MGTAAHDRVVQGTPTQQLMTGRTVALPSSFAAAWVYVEALKPRESAMLAFIGTCTFVIARGPFARLPATLVAILLASAGANGLTNYLDRDFDARMQRTRRRPLPSGRIDPPERLLPITGIATLAGLTVAGLLSPVAALAGATGTVTAVLARKTWVTHYLGILSSLAPILMGWFAAGGEVSPTLILISAVVGLWVPVHVWTVMVTWRDDYLQAGIKIFPVTAPTEISVRLIFLLGVLLVIASGLLYFVGELGAVYLGGVAALGLVQLTSSWRLMARPDGKAAWRLHRVTTYPYLGLFFVFAVLDRLLAPIL